MLAAVFSFIVVIVGVMGLSFIIGQKPPVAFSDVLASAMVFSGAVLVLQSLFDNKLGRFTRVFYGVFGVVLAIPMALFLIRDWPVLNWAKEKMIIGGLGWLTDFHFSFDDLMTRVTNLLSGSSTFTVHNAFIVLVAAVLGVGLLLIYLLSMLLMKESDEVEARGIQIAELERIEADFDAQVESLMAQARAADAQNSGIFGLANLPYKDSLLEGRDLKINEEFLRHPYRVDLGSIFESDIHRLKGLKTPDMREIYPSKLRSVDENFPLKSPHDFGFDPSVIGYSSDRAHGAFAADALSSLKRDPEASSLDALIDSWDEPEDQEGWSRI